MFDLLREALVINKNHTIAVPVKPSNKLSKVYDVDLLSAHVLKLYEIDIISRTS